MKFDLIEYHKQSREREREREMGEKDRMGGGRGVTEIRRLIFSTKLKFFFY